MEVICQSCEGKFTLPDEKVPKGQVFAITCPKCKNKISIDTREGEAPAAAAGGDAGAAANYDASDRPFDFIEEGTKTALICEANPTVRAKVKAALENLGYYITTPGSAREVLKQMRFHVFDVVIINERFDTPRPDDNNVLRYMDRLPMTHRRDMFVILLTDRFRTGDDMVAFNKSVHSVVNLQHVDEFDKVFQKAHNDYTYFYRIFKETQKRLGQV